MAYLGPGELTWRRPFPTERSRTPAAWLSGRRAALRPCWQEDGRPRRRPSSGRAARTGNERFLHTGWDSWDSTPDQCDRGSPGRRRRTDMKCRETCRKGATLAQVQHLLPQWRLWGQAGDGSNHPAVTQTALVQVTCTDAINKQARILTDLLGSHIEIAKSNCNSIDEKNQHNSTYTGQFRTTDQWRTFQALLILNAKTGPLPCGWPCPSVVWWYCNRILPLLNC